MLMLPLPLLIAEIVIFVLAVQEWGFLATVGYYLIPCLLGLFIVSSMRRFAWTQMQVSMMQGQMPAQTMLHSALVFVSGLLFLVPSFFTRVLGVIFFLPGLRHLASWKIKKVLQQKMTKGGGAFGFSQNFGFGNMGGAGFRYYDFRSQQSSEMGGEERDVTQSDPKVLDVTPLEIVHSDSESKKNS